MCSSYERLKLSSLAVKTDHRGQTPYLPNMGTFKSWAPLWSGLVDSSIWDEDDDVFRVFMAMISLKDQDHIVRLTAYQLSRRIRRNEQDVLKALVILSSPDTKRSEPQDFEGRRIEQVEEGWKILNGEKYRYLVQLEMKRARNRRSQQSWRNRQKIKNTPLAGETATVKAAEDGHLDPKTFEPKPLTAYVRPFQPKTPPPGTIPEI
jgi:hypothetical protein